jgi:hypothetical protein
MGTWTSFFVKTTDKAKLVEALRSALPRITEVVEDQPGSITNDIQPSTNSQPDRLVLAQTNPEWCVVFHNSFDKLDDLALGLSQDLDTSVIVTMAQSVSDYYYFALYSNGHNKREIEVCYSDDTEMVNTGERFHFENEEPGEKEEYDGEVSYLFGFDSLEQYCKQFGFNMYEKPENFRWTLLQNPKYKFAPKPTANTPKVTISNTKPWWKFW